MTERLLIVFTRVHTRSGVRDGEFPDEYVTLWGQPDDSPHWILTDSAGRGLLVIHGADYGTSAGAIAEKALKALTAALAAYPNAAPGQGRELGLALHGDVSALKQAHFSDLIGVKPLFVSGYSRYELFGRLARIVTKSGDMAEEFDQVWAVLARGVAAALYREAGVLRHRASRLSGLMQNLATWTETGFAPDDADAIAAECRQQPFDADGFRALFAGPDSFEALVMRASRKLLQRRNELLLVRQRLHAVIPIGLDGVASLPESLVHLIDATGSADGIRDWIRDDRGNARARDLLAWWKRLQQAMDELLELLAVADRTEAPGGSAGAARR